MGGYSKMSKSFGNSNPSSSDFFHHHNNSQPPPITNPSFSETKLSPPPLAKEEAEATKETEHHQQPQPQLRRNSSVSSAANHLKQRALSFSFSNSNNVMRRSSSVSERYCRIHDQSSVFLPDHPYGKMDPMPETTTATSPAESPSNYSPSTSSQKKKKLMSKSGIVRACKKILGL